MWVNSSRRRVVEDLELAELPEQPAQQVQPPEA
jgi:hypothetical protein